MKSEIDMVTNENYIFDMKNEHCY